MATKLNSYFCNIGSDLAAKLPPSSSSQGFCDYLPNPLSNSMVFEEIAVQEVENIITKFKNRTGRGADNIPFKFIYEFSDMFSTYLCHIFNISIQQGIYPEAMKISRTIPIPKTKTELDSPNNYRPISLLGNFSKIFEKIVAIRFLNFF